MKIFLTADLVNEILNYLSNKPFKEANPLISKILQEVRLNENEKQEELDLTTKDEGGISE
jgi:hypothetical protein|tara:strand:- start:584 stop:763 length:180 start_codon:yes stop_codon:yes gene_type:complete